VETAVETVAGTVTTDHAVDVAMESAMDMTTTTMSAAGGMTMGMVVEDEDVGPEVSFSDLSDVPDIAKKAECEFIAKVN